MTRPLSAQKWYLPCFSTDDSAAAWRPWEEDFHPHVHLSPFVHLHACHSSCYLSPEVTFSRSWASFSPAQAYCPCHGLCVPGPLWQPVPGRTAHPRSHSLLLTLSALPATRLSFLSVEAGHLPVPDCQSHSSRTSIPASHQNCHRCHQCSAGCRSPESLRVLIDLLAAFHGISPLHSAAWVWFSSLCPRCLTRNRFR